jgi:hypothetical protein
MYEIAWHAKVAMNRVVCVENKEIIGFIKSHLKRERTIEPEITPFNLLDISGYVSLFEKVADEIHRIIS